MTNGVHLILARDDAKSVFGARDPDRLLEIVSSLLESATGETRYQSGPDWDLARQTLERIAEKKSASEQEGSLLGQCYLGGRRLLDDAGKLVVLVRPDLVPHLAAELADISREVLAAETEGTGEETRDGLWQTLAGLRTLFQAASEQRSAILFTNVSRS